MYRVDLNSDLGESFGRYTLGSDDKIIPLITSANVACGYHASDPVVMEPYRPCPFRRGTLKSGFRYGTSYCPGGFCRPCL